MLKDKKLWIGIILMVVSSLITSIGQLMWKLSAENNLIWMYILGFALYGIGAFLMIIAFKFGELSVLHPMMSVGYIMSIILGAVILNENISSHKLLGIGLIIVGMFFLGHSGSKREGELK